MAKERQRRQRSLTDAYVRQLRPPATGDVEVSDARCVGLYFRVTTKGARSWAFRYRAPITRRVSRVTIGRYPDMGLSKARARADTLRAQVADGIDLAAKRRDARASSESQTFEFLANRYLKEHARQHKRSHANDDRNLRLHILPRWRSRAYVSITRADVIELLNEIVADGKLVLVNRLQSLISGIFSFAVDAELLPANPIFRLKRRGVESVGERVLSNPELRLFWPAVVDPPVSEMVGNALRLSLLTGARISEVAGMARDELEHIQDDAAAAWTVPGARTKNGKPHLIPLPPTARAIILDRLGQIEHGARHLFPARDHAGASIKGVTLSRAMWRLGEHFSKGNTRDDAVRTWRADRPSAHDLRRTFATRQAALGTSKEVRDRLLNHVAGGRDTERKSYNKYEFAAEKRLALSVWDATLSAILDDRSADVVPISKGRRR